jgi:hypothetical protein
LLPIAPTPDRCHAAASKTTITDKTGSRADLTVFLFCIETVLHSVAGSSILAGLQMQFFQCLHMNDLTKSGLQPVWVIDAFNLSL